MTKKATWSGYRGDGKPVIPCVPECMVEKSMVGTSSVATRTPSDYRKPSESPSSSPRKHMKRVRNELLLGRSKPEEGIWADEHYYLYQGMHQQKVAAVQKAYKAGDLDLLMTYKKYWYRKSFQSVLGTIQVLRAMGHTLVEGVITDDHVDIFHDVSLMVAAHGYRPMVALRKANPLISAWDIMPDTFVTQDIYDIVMIAMSGKAENDAVRSILMDREITDPEEVGKLVKEMLVESSALAHGVL